MNLQCTFVPVIRIVNYIALVFIAAMLFSTSLLKGFTVEHTSVSHPTSDQLTGVNFTKSSTNLLSIQNEHPGSVQVSTEVYKIPQLADFFDFFFQEIVTISNPKMNAIFTFKSALKTTFLRNLLYPFHFFW